jgi:hypothetical protein
MAKIHTHYDNLKVARLAPQEVIRAAYKALTQKYHPDKNPGDEKAARIMAILNTAYGILGDPVRRKEHDEWIAAEEWEIAWLDSTRADEAHKAREGAPAGWEPQPVEAAPYRRARDPKWWGGLAACFAAGCAAGLLIVEQPKVVPIALASVLNPAPPQAPAPAEPRPDPALDGWAVSKAYLPDGSLSPPDVRALAVTQLVVPAHAPGCDAELHALVAPNGESWPLVPAGGRRLPGRQPGRGNAGHGRQFDQQRGRVRQAVRPRPARQRAPRLRAGAPDAGDRQAGRRQVRSALPERRPGRQPGRLRRAPESAAAPGRRRALAASIAALAATVPIIWQARPIPDCPTRRSLHGPPG